MATLLQSENIFFDLPQISSDIILVFPLSMCRLHSGQNPDNIKKFIKFFLSRCKTTSIDIVFLYTNSLYFNQDNIAHEVRQKIRNQMLNHTEQLRSSIRILNIPCKSLHFLPWDYISLNGKEYRNRLSKLQKLYHTMPIFSYLTNIDLNGRPAKDWSRNNIPVFINQIIL